MDLKSKIAEIQKGMGTLIKDTEAFKYKYVTLDQIQEKMNPLLEKHKILLLQPMHYSHDSGVTTLDTELWDLEGDDEAVISSSIALPNDVKPQDLGSAISYFRRYSLLSLFNLVTEDDDGAKASGVKSKKSGELSVDEI